MRALRFKSFQVGVLVRIFELRLAGMPQRKVVCEVMLISLSTASDALEGVRMATKQCTQATNSESVEVIVMVWRPRRT